MKNCGFWIIVLCLAATSCASQPSAPSTHDGAFRPVAVERLPDLNVPRAGHVLACPGGELTVIGGHTTGFVLTQTAEYYKDGSWHLLQTLYPHDFGFGVALPSEEVLVGGGCAEPFGIGQTWAVEMYDPATHSFSPLPILDKKRGANTSAARLSDGRIIIAGNWYADDMISTYSPQSGGESLFVSSQDRSMPLILQTSADNALILGSFGARGEILPPLADRLKGDPIEIPLLQEWDAWNRSDVCPISNFFIGDEAVGGYAWLFPAIRKSDGQLGLIKVVGEEFSILETERPLPMTGPEGESLSPGALLLADRSNKCAWIIRSVVGKGQFEVDRVDYEYALNGGNAPVSSYLAELPDGLSFTSSSAVLLPGGNIAFAGGLTDFDNYHPVATAFILHTEPDGNNETPWLWWLLASLAALSLISTFVWMSRKKRIEAARTGQDADGETADGAIGDEAEMERRMEDLMARITVLMEEGEAFRKKDLSKEYLSRVLGTNVRYLSDCINRKAGCSFIDYVNGYRIRYSQRLLYENPDMRLSEISEESGFSSEVTFYRNFKARTGQTPSEWLASQDRPAESDL